MNLPHPTHLFLLLALAGSGLTAADKFDLKRITPVPANQPIPLQDFFRTPLLFQPTLNPSGTHLAALVTASEDKQSALIVDLKKNKPDTVSAPGDTDFINLAWLDDSHLVTSLSKDKYYLQGMFAMEVGRLGSGYPLLQFTGARLVGVPRKDRLHPLVWVGSGLEDGNEAIGVCRINSQLDTGTLLKTYAGVIEQDSFVKARALNRRHILKEYPQPKESAGSGYNVDYLSDKDGELAFCTVGRKGYLKLYRFADGDWQACPIDLDNFEVVDAGNEPDQLVVRPLERTGKPQPLQFINAVTGQLGEVLVQDKAYDPIGSLYRDRQTGTIVGVQYGRSALQSTWFDENYKAVQKLIEASFPGLVVRIIDNNEAGNLFLVATFSDRQPTIYHWVDLATKAAGMVKNSAPWIDPARMQPMNVMKFKTRDGRTLDAYVTLPAGATKQNPPPLVVLSHGGPWARDTWGFNGEVQFLASRGYAVLQTNYRGSRGYDWMFPEEDRYAFRKMHDDVTDATRTLIKSGLVDPKRVGIMGGSFGAYLGLSGVAHEPDLYRCAVVNAGVFDWEVILREEKYFQYSDNGYAYLVRKLGDPKKEKEKFEAISPARHVANVRVPVFVAHGKDDPIAPISESKRLVGELQKNRIPHETFFKSDEGHGMAHLDNQVELYEKIEAFLAKHLMAAP